MVITPTRNDLSRWIPEQNAVRYIEQLFDAINDIAYETGAYTPIFNAIAAPTYTTQEGEWFRIGNRLFVNIGLEYSGLDTSDVSVLQVTLPFEIDNTGISDGYGEGLVEANFSTGLLLGTTPYQIKYYGGSNTVGVQIGDTPGAVWSKLKYNNSIVQTSGKLIMSLNYKAIV